MSYQSFWKLHEKLKEGIVLAHKQYLEKGERGVLVAVSVAAAGSIALPRHQFQMAKLTVKCGWLVH